MDPWREKQEAGSGGDEGVGTVTMVTKVSSGSQTTWMHIQLGHLHAFDSRRLNSVSSSVEQRDNGAHSMRLL